MKKINLLNSKQLADILGVSQQAVYLKRISGKIDKKFIVKIGNKFYYKPEILNALKKK